MKKKLILSLVLGAVFGLLCAGIRWFVDRSHLWMSVTAGILFASVLFLVFVYQERILRNRYAAVEKEFTTQPELCQNVNVRLGNTARNGNIYVFENVLWLLCLDAKPCINLPLPYASIRSLEFPSDLQLILGVRINEEDFEFIVTASNIKTLYQSIRSHLSAVEQQS